MRKCLVLVSVLIVLFFVFPIDVSSQSITPKDDSTTVAISSGPSELEEFYRTSMVGYYDVVIFPEKQDKKSIGNAIKKATKEFMEALISLCESHSVAFSILSKTGPDQIDYKERLSFIISLSGKNADITEVDRALQDKYEDLPKHDPYGP